jgi:hypothetical protein
MECAITECQENGCNGQIAAETFVSVIIGCRFGKAAFPCNNCGRLHGENGQLLFGRDGSKMFFKNGRFYYE